MSRDYRAYLADILFSIDKIERYTRRKTFLQFKTDELVQDAVVRNLEIIGEATKKLPGKRKQSEPDIEWDKIAGLRNILAHEYFGVDNEIVWQIVKKKLPQLRKAVQSITGHNP